MKDEMTCFERFVKELNEAEIPEDLYSICSERDNSICIFDEEGKVKLYLIQHGEKSSEFILDDICAVWNQFAKYAYYMIK